MWRRRSPVPLHAHTPASSSPPPHTRVEPTAKECDESVSLGGSVTGYGTEIEPTSFKYEAFGLPMSTDLTLSRESMTSPRSIPPLIPTIPPGTVREDDMETMNAYFTRHPFEQVISLEFVDEMNASVFMVFQDSPMAVGDALCSIGHVYLEEDGQGSLLPLALDRRARTLARLKAKDPSRELEQMLLMSLALGAMEVSFSRQSCPSLHAPNINHQQ